MIDKKIEGTANSILLELNINQPPIDIISIAKSYNISIKPYDLGEGVSGVLVIDKDKSVIGYNPSEHPHRQRFTVAHEFGHYVLHRKHSELFVDKEKVLFRNQDSATGEFKREREANNFAAAMLMPKYLLENEAKKRDTDFFDEASISDLAKLFNVSVQAMTIRLTKLNMLW